VTPSSKTLPDGSFQLSRGELRLDAAAATHAGQVREANEDVYALLPDLRLFVVADGMGGRAAGEIAARIGVDTLESFYREHRNTDPSAWPFPADPQHSRLVNLLRVGLKLANQRVLEESKHDAAWYRMGATVAVLAFDENSLVAAHAGDVRIYRFRGGVASRLTRDHSIVEEMRLARPGLTPQQLEALGNRNVVTRALGSRADLEPTVYLNSFLDGDTYLICSDGLWGCVADDAITAIINAQSDLETACHGLVDAANRAGAPDNVTALLVRVHR
jgi:PPM family protein phosphatase